jgi:hypothetical protein
LQCGFGRSGLTPSCTQIRSKSSCHREATVF